MKTETMNRTEKLREVATELTLMYLKHFKPETVNITASEMTPSGVGYLAFDDVEFYLSFYYCEPFYQITLSGGNEEKTWDFRREETEPQDFAIEFWEFWQKVSTPLQLKTFTQEVVIQHFETLAKTEEDAETKYQLWHEGGSCTEEAHRDLSVTECGCIEVEEDVYHITKRQNFLASDNLPQGIANLTISTDRLGQIAKEIKANGTTAMNLALVLDLLVAEGLRG